MSPPHHQLADQVHEPFEIRLASPMEAVSAQRWLIDTHPPDSTLTLRDQHDDRIFLSGTRQAIATFLHRKRAQRAISDTHYADAVSRLRSAR